MIVTIHLQYNSLKTFRVTPESLAVKVTLPKSGNLFKAAVFLDYSLLFIQKINLQYM